MTDTAGDRVLPKRDPVVEPSKPRLLSILGPGLITGASDDDPSGIATYSQAGAQFGYGTTWTLLFTYPLMVAAQMISALIGRTTGRGIAGNLRLHYPGWLVGSIVGLLLVANIINIGADIGAMGDAVALLIGGPRFLYVLLFGAVCIALQILMRYRRYVTILKWLTLALFSYVATLFMVNVDWGAFLEAFLIPSLSFDVGHVTIIVAIFGTTISPYLFFWQSAQEVEDIEAHPRRKPLTQAPAQAPSAVRRIELDTLVGMALSNVIALAIMVTAAATLNAGGITDIGSSAEAAKALAPIAGAAAEAVFALGIIGTGLLAVPVLAGSAAYALGEILHVPVGLARRFREARAFYVAIALATGIGVLFDLTPIDPIRALFWSAVINGVVAAPVMAMMMLLATRRAVMGEQVIGRRLAVFGWLATVAMAASVVAMALTSF